MDYMEISIYMIKQGAIILTGVVILLLSGCTIDWKKGAEYAIDSAKEVREKQEEKEQTDSHDTSEDDEYIYISEQDVQDKTDEIADIVEMAFEEQDKQILIDLFSEYSMDEYDLDSQIDQAFDFIEGNIVSVGNKTGGYSGGSTSAKHGDIKTLYEGDLCKVVTDAGKTYTITFQGVYNFRNHDNQIGLHCIYIGNDQIHRNMAGERPDGEFTIGAWIK